MINDNDILIKKIIQIDLAEKNFYISSSYIHLPNYLFSISKKSNKLWSLVASSPLIGG